IRGNTATARYQHTSAGILIPSFDGQMLFTSHGVFDSNLQILGEQEAQNMICLPSYQPQYFLGIQYGTIVSSKPVGDVLIHVYSTGDRPRFLQLQALGFGPINPNPTAGSQGLSLDRRIHLMPAANLCIVIPPSADQLFLHRINITDAMEKAGIDYLFV